MRKREWTYAPRDPDDDMAKLHAQYENPALYELAKQITHEEGLDWFDPRTGEKHPAPTKEKK